MWGYRLKKELTCNAERRKGGQEERGVPRRKTALQEECPPRVERI
jgi:hypothetical protein